MVDKLHNVALNNFFLSTLTLFFSPEKSDPILWQ